MKRLTGIFLTIALMTVLLPLAATGQTDRRHHIKSRIADTLYYPKKQSTYRKHRNLINIGIGTGIGALLGGILAGKKGALIGAGAGAGGAAIYTYKIKPKKKRRGFWRRFLDD